MKSKINKYIKSILKVSSLLLLLVIVLVSCDLERQDFDKLNEDTFLTTEADLEANIAALYIDITSGGGHGGRFTNGITMSGYIFLEMVAQVMDCRWNWGEVTDHLYTSQRFITDGSSGGAQKFRVGTRNMTAARSFILNASNLDLPDNVKNPLIAEAHAVRAYYALMMYNIFGPLPIVPDEDIQNNLFEYYPRASKEDFIAEIQYDIDQALALGLPSPQEQEFGRFNTGTANFILMKLYMIEKDWTKVKKYAEDIMALGYYQLQDSYTDVFSVHNKQNREIVHAVVANASVPGAGNTWHAHVMMGQYPDLPGGLGPWHGYTLRWSVVDQFDPADRRLLDGVITSFTGNDGVEYGRPDPADADGGGVFQKGAIPLKYDFDPNQQGASSNHDYIVWRYADVLLALAEAINELGGGDRDLYFNQVRERTDIGDIDPGLNQQEFRDAILQERLFEFWGEGIYYSDLVRHGKLIETARTNPLSQINDDMILFPIHQELLLEYQGKLTQNPGY